MAATVAIAPAQVTPAFALVPTAIAAPQASIVVLPNVVFPPLNAVSQAATPAAPAAAAVIKAVRRTRVVC